MKNYRVILSILWKDFIIEIRTREIFASMLVFAILVTIVFNFALDLQPNMQKTLASGILWVSFAFAGTLGINRSMAGEQENSALDGLMLSPIDPSIIYLGKTLSIFLLMFFVEMLILPIFSFFYAVNLFKPELFLVCILGSLGYAALGIFLASIVRLTRARDILLPVLLFPIAIPLLIASVKASSAFLDGDELQTALVWLNLLIAYDVIFITTGYLTYPFLNLD